MIATRETFSTSRTLEYFSKRELVAQTGTAPEWWPEMTVKELVDNGLDAAETKGVSPKVRVVVDDCSIMVVDNGSGLPIATLQSALDYTIKVSDKARYVSPSRGQQGNALKTVVALPYVLHGTAGRVEVSTGGQGYEITVATDQIRQEPKVELLNGRKPFVKTGTGVKVHWPDSACSSLTSNGARFLQIGTGFATLNPHLALSLKAPQGKLDFSPTAPAWSKWLPSWPTSPHWYTGEDLSGLIAAYIGHDQGRNRERTVREFVAEFCGLSGSAKQKVVCDSVSLSRAPLSSLASGGDLDLQTIGRLLVAMQRESRAIKPAALGVIGEEHLRHRVREVGGDIDSFRYCRKLGTVQGLPYVIETAFVCASWERRREVIAGVNWSPTFGGVPFDGLGDGWTLDSLLQEQRCGVNEPIILVLHLAIPKVHWQDRGKSAVSLDGELGEAFTSAVVAVTSKWAKQRKSEERDHRRTARRHEAMVRSGRVTVKDAAYAAIPAAYAKASGGGKYPTPARTIMYAARPDIQDATGEPLDDRYFTQGLLPNFCNEHPELTANWDIVYDARGHFREPHTKRQTDLGTLGVRRYLSDISCFTPNWQGVVRLPDIQLGGGLHTVGPQYRFRDILFPEKEGFDPLWDSVRLQQRYDLALMSCKGVSSTSGRHLLDGLTQSDREFWHLIRVIVLHDFDVAGFKILHSLTASNRRYRFAHEVKVHDLGLRLADIQAMGLQSEKQVFKSKPNPATLKRYGATDEEIEFLLSGQRVELNAMTSPQMVEFVERKLTEIGVTKIVPDAEALQAGYRHLIAIRQMQRTIDEAREEIESEAQDTIIPDDLSALIQQELTKRPHLSWDEALAGIVDRKSLSEL